MAIRPPARMIRPGTSPATRAPIKARQGFDNLGPAGNTLLIGLARIAVLVGVALTICVWCAAIGIAATAVYGESGLHSALIQYAGTL